MPLVTNSKGETHYVEDTPEAQAAARRLGYMDAPASSSGQINTPSPATPTAPTVPTGFVRLRDTATGQGLNVGNQGATPLINGNVIDTTGMQNIGGHWYGSPEQIDQLLSPYVYKSPVAGQEQAAFDAYNQWASQPYVSEYAPQIEGLVRTILSRTFQYDPTNDQQFQLASKELTRNVMESMNARGILNSTVTENQVQQEVANMMPQYQQIARQNFQDEGQMLMSQVDMLAGLDNTSYGRYQDEGQKLAGALDVVMKMDDRQYQKWSDAYERRYQSQQDEIAQADKKVQADRQKIQDAWDRVSERGFVDNQASIILGVEASTLSKDAREAKIKREQELEDQRTQLKNQKELAAYQHSLSQKLAKERDTLTTTQLFNQAKDMITAKVSTGEFDENEKPIYRPKYTRQEFEIWLANLFPMTPEGDKAYDDFVAALNLDSVEFYMPESIPEYTPIQKQHSNN
jgi:hypothetical protein